MNKKKLVPFITGLVLLMTSIACGLTSGRPQSQEPISSIYATAISAGGTHACALLNNDTVMCWGENSSGQLGDGSYPKQNTAIEVPGLIDVIAVSAGGEHTCALISNGEVKCWGKNNSGQLGDGTKTMSTEPVSVTGLTDVIAISAGGEHTCAITKDGGLRCWGKNLYGRVGDGSSTRLILTPVDVVGVNKDIISISAGSEHTCALSTNGEAKCWGNNNYGQVGDSTTTNRKEAVNIVGLAKVSTIGTGFSTTCAVTNESRVACWGWIGLQDYSTSPHEVDTFGNNLAEIAVGGDHICALTNDGIVKCLGENEYGQLGNGTTTPAYTANNVGGLSNVKAITANFNFTCALLANGDVMCWGQNDSGQLGNGTNVGSLEPVQVIGISQ